MSSRFRRDYLLTIGLGSQKVEISPPFNISFSSIENVDNKSLNKLQLTIPGLKESTRQKLIKYELDKSIYLPVELLIGYEGSLQRVFKGSVQTGMPSKQGADHIITLDCQDGHPDFNEAYTSQTVTSTSLAIGALIASMPNMEKGTITALPETLRPRVMVGSSSSLMEEMAQGKQMYIKDQKVYILNDNEVTSAIAPVVNADTGLLASVEQDHIDTTFSTMLNPSLRIGGLCNLQSTLNPAANGLYKIWQIASSGSYKGKWNQTVTCRKQNDYVVVR